MNIPINLIVRKENAKARKSARRERLWALALPVVGIAFVILGFAL